MHKFIIVGHPQSGYQEVENLLHECGMGVAKPSRREGLLPAQISEMLRQAHGTPALAALTAPDQIEQIGTAPVWHGMAMDLMLGNLDQRFWGWSDPGAIHLLEYWKQLDPSINFVFVYADPQSALVGPDADDALSVQAKLANWQAFNAAMLHFYNRNPKRSVLVHADQVRHSVRAYLQQLRTQLNAPLNDPPAHLLLAAEAAEADRDVEMASEPEASTAAGDDADSLPVASRTDVASVDELGLGDVVDDAALPRFVASHCVAQHPGAGQLYDELQAVAQLPLDLGRLPGPAAEAAWVALLMNTRRAERQKIALREHEAQLAVLQQQAEQRRAALEHLGQDVEQKQKALADSERRIDGLHVELARLQDVLADHTQRNEKSESALALLLDKLDQESVARQAHERSLSESAAALEAAQAALASVQQEAKAHRSALELADREVQQTQQALASSEGKSAELAGEIERLRAALAEHAEVKEENELLLAQLHQVQEELERFFLARVDDEKALALAKSNEVTLRQKLEALQVEEAKLKDALAKKTAEQNETASKNKLLADQLKAVQEEHKRLSAEKETLSKALEAAKSSERNAVDKLKAAEKAEKDGLSRLAELKRELEVLRTEEAKLKDVLAKKTAEHQDTLEENELLLIQLHAVQEELERIFLDKESLNKTLAAAKDSERVTLDKLKAAEKAAEKAAKEGANRLTELNREIDALRGVEAKLKAAEKAKKDGTNRLAALKRDLESVRAEETKLKGVVNNKIAEQKKTQNENRRLLTQLQVVQEQLERQHAEIRHLKKTMVPRNPPLYGAAERVKQQLTYQLGATMIQKSKSVGGWISMPFALIGTTRKFRTEQRALRGQKLQPIFKYADADQAERVRQHLSYRIGAVLLRNVKSPVGWVRLPFALRREVKAFRHEQKEGAANA